MKLQNRFSLFFIIAAIGLTIYFFSVVYQYPLIGIEIKEIDGQWVVENIYQNGWAARESLEEGSILKQVDGKDPEENRAVRYFSIVEKAKTIMLEDSRGITGIYTVSYHLWDSQYIIYLFIPMFFTVIMISLSVFLYIRKKEDKSARMLIYFLLTIGLVYFGASASARGDFLSRMVTLAFLPGSLLLFIQFLNTYLLKYQLYFINRRMNRFFIGVYLFALLMMFGSIFLRNLSSATSMVHLILFLILSIFLFFHFTIFYIKNRESDGKSVLKIMLATMFLAFSPFVFLYGLPNVLFKRELVSGEITAFFLVVIPIVFVYLQLAEKLFDIEFLLNRLRYYSLLAFPFSLLVIILLSIFMHSFTISRLHVRVFVTLYVSTTLFLYLKEYIDYKFRHHLFSQKSSFERSLYKFFQKAKYETKVKSLIENLMNEVKAVLNVREVHYIEIKMNSNENQWIISSEGSYPDDFYAMIKGVKWDHFQIGALIELNHGYCIIIGDDYHSKNLIFFGLKRFVTNLNIQEKIWLETIAYYSGILLENFQLIEGLFRKIENYREEMQEVNEGYPYWLSRLLFSLSEKERTNLSIDLHDSVLQDQLQLLRDVDLIVEQTSDTIVKESLHLLKEKMLDNIHQIRETCNELRPPFLRELGIIQSLGNLIEQTKLRADFILHVNMDRSIKQLDPEIELVIYRVVQELLNNAMKHSQASIVCLSLKKVNKQLVLSYSDDGIGIDMTKLNDSFKTMGISGMKERVRSLGGSMTIDSIISQSLHIQIKLELGGVQVD